MNFKTKGRVVPITHEGKLSFIPQYYDQGWTGITEDYQTWAVIEYQMKYCLCNDYHTAQSRLDNYLSLVN